MTLTLREVMTREYRREFADYVQFGKGASRSIARRAARECPPGTIRGRLPVRRKIMALIRTFKYWRAQWKL
jgi:hypothetical protein